MYFKRLLSEMVKTVKRSNAEDFQWQMNSSLTVTQYSILIQYILEVESIGVQFFHTKFYSLLL